MEPFATALTLAGAVRVDVTAFRTLDANPGVNRPVVGRDFQILELPGRRARAGKEHQIG